MVSEGRYAGGEGQHAGGEGQHAEKAGDDMHGERGMVC